MVQLECVNCTACIDECDTIMESVGLPKGLRLCLRGRNRENTHFKFTARMKGYTVLFYTSRYFDWFVILRTEVEV
jgi:polyferredoxin